jgi:hypothetical protein
MIGLQKCEEVASSYVLYFFIKFYKINKNKSETVTKQQFCITRFHFLLPLHFITLYKKNPKINTIVTRRERATSKHHLLEWVQYTVRRRTASMLVEDQFPAIQRALNAFSQRLCETPASPPLVHEDTENIEERISVVLKPHVEEVCCPDFHEGIVLLLREPTYYWFAPNQLCRNLPKPSKHELSSIWMHWQ